MNNLSNNFGGAFFDWGNGTSAGAGAPPQPPRPPSRPASVTSSVRNEVDRMRDEMFRLEVRLTEMRVENQNALQSILREVRAIRPPAQSSNQADPLVCNNNNPFVHNDPPPPYEPNARDPPVRVNRNQNQDSLNYVQPVFPPPYRPVTPQPQAQGGYDPHQDEDDYYQEARSHQENERRRGFHDQPPPPQRAASNFGGHHNERNHGNHERENRLERPLYDNQRLTSLLSITPAFTSTTNPVNWINALEHSARMNRIPLSVLLLNLNHLFQKADTEAVKTWFKGVEAVISHRISEGQDLPRVWAYFRRSLIEYFSSEVLRAKARADLSSLKFKPSTDPQKFFNLVQAAMRQANPESSDEMIIQAVLDRIPGVISHGLIPASMHANLGDFLTKFIGNATSHQRALEEEAQSRRDSSAPQLCTIRNNQPSAPKPVNNASAPIRENPPEPVVCAFCHLNNHTTVTCRRFQKTVEEIRALDSALTMDEIYDYFVRNKSHISPAFKEYLRQQNHNNQDRGISSQPPAASYNNNNNPPAANQGFNNNYQRRNYNQNYNQNHANVSGEQEAPTREQSKNE